MKKQNIGLLVSFAILLFLTISSIFFLQYLKTAKQKTLSLPIFGEIPAFDFKDPKGYRVNLDMLRGKVWVADFIFTRCGGPCPLISGRFADLQNSLPDKDRVKLISFTVDPDFDTPEVLAEYAKKFGAEEDVWLFLRGEKEKINSLAQKGFFLATGDSEDPEHQILHSTRIVLVDGRGRIRGYYDSENAAVNQQLLRDIKILLQEKE